MEKIDFKEMLEIEVVDASDKDKKAKAFNIIRNNDFLQYHYFAQGYDVVKTASYLFVISIKYKNVKTRIGFISLNSPSLDKTLRTRYYGMHMLRMMYEKKMNLKAYVISRIVLLPSFRGLGITSFLVDSVIDFLKSQDDFFYVELVSNMFHTFYFGGTKLDRTFIDLKKSLSENDYNEYFASLNGKMARGYRETELIGNMSFFHNDKHNQIFTEWYKNKYNIDVDFNLENKIDSDDIVQAKELSVPLIFLKHTNMSLQEIKDVIKDIK